MAEQTVEREDMRPFSEFFHAQRAGQLHEDATEALHRLVTAVRDTGRPGELVIKVSVKPAAQSGVAMFVSDAVSVKLPSRPNDPGYYFIDRHGNLSRRDPNQPDLPLREPSVVEPRQLGEHSA